MPFKRRAPHAAIFIIAVSSIPFAFAPFIFGISYEYNGPDVFVLPRVRDSGISCFAIAVPSLFISVVEVVAFILALSKRRLETHTEWSNDLGLCPPERLVFMSGAALLSAFSFLPLNLSPSFKFVFSNCCTRYSVSLMLVSIVCYLHRNTEVWTTPRTLTVVCFVFISIAMSAACYCFEGTITNTLTLLGAIFSSVATIIFLWNCALCFVNILRPNPTQFCAGKSDPRDIVIALHMIAAIYVILSAGIINSILAANQASLVETVHWTFFVGIVLVVLIESWLKNQIRLELLEKVASTKKAYIR